MTFTRRDRWDDSQQRMMRSATRHHSSRTVVVARIPARWMRTLPVFAVEQGKFAHQSIATANVAQVSGLLDQLKGYEGWTVNPLREIQSENRPDSRPYLFSSLALRRAATAD